MYELIVKANDGQIVSTQRGSDAALKERAKDLRAYYKKCGYSYRVSVRKIVR